MYNLMTNKTCPCGNQAAYQACCEPYHTGIQIPAHPEALMRARYTAHVLGLIEFIIKTYHPSCKAAHFREAISQTMKNDWQKLEVISSEIGENPEEGFVTFKAHYLTQGRGEFLYEKSRFILERKKDEMHWYYIDGIYPKPTKTGRNDPCFCGSGKKRKKCCH